MRLAVGSLLSLALLAPLSLSAQGWVVPPTCDPVPCTRGVPCRRVCPPVGVSAIARTASDVRVEVADRVLRYEVTEKFTNRGGALGEADYFFPLPAGAAFQDLKLS